MPRLLLRAGAVAALLPFASEAVAQSRVIRVGALY